MRRIMPWVLATWTVMALGFGAGFVTANATREAPPDNTKIRVFEDGSGSLPAGTHNSVLGDLSGRGFCLYGELCNDGPVK